MEMEIQAKFSVFYKKKASLNYKTAFFKILI